MATIIIKNSTGSGVLPSSLQQGELAINTKDGRLFYGSGSGNNVVEFTGGGATFPYTGSAIISGSLTVTGSFNVGGNTTQDGYLQFNPVTTNINQSLSASYIYVSGSTNDLYFTQNSNGFGNTTRLRWLEGNLYTGLLNGGLITSASSTTFNVSSGSGIIVTLNASLTDNPYPTIRYVNWGNITNQTLTYRTSSLQTFIGIDSGSNVIQQTSPWNDGEFNTSIQIGTVLHQNFSTINGSISYPNVAYGYKQRSYDFIRAFGPLKLSGYSILPSSSLGLTVGSGTAFSEGRNYQVDPNNPSYVTDSGTAVSKIFRYYQSSSTFVQDTNGGAGYTVIDPTQYNPLGSGSLSSVPGGSYTVQRVFWYPNSTTKGIVVYYGTATYNSLTNAKAGYLGESFNEVPNTIQNAVYLGAIAIKGNGDFNTPADYQIIPGGLFRSSLGGLTTGGSGGGTTPPGGSTTQIQYNNAGAFGGVPTLTYNGTTLSATGSFTGSLTGILTGTASYATQALSASYAPAASTFPYIGNAVITGSLIVSGSAGGIDTTNGYLNDSTGIASVAWSQGNKFLRDDSNNTSIEWGNRIAYDSIGNASIDYENRILSEGTGTYVAFEYSSDVYTTSQLYHRAIIPPQVQRSLSNGPAITGQIIEGTVDVGVSDFWPVFLDTDGTWKGVKSTVANGAAQMLGICASQANGQVLIEGDVGASDDGSQGTYVVGADYGLPVYVSGTTGRLTTTAPSSTGEVVRIVGHIYYNSSTDVNWWTMKFRPDNGWYVI